MSLISNLRKRGLIDLFNPKKWKIFARYLAIKAFKKEYSEMFVPEYLEQISLRMSHPGCRQCFHAGECTHCGCKTPDLFFEKSMECSGNHWSTMISPEDWNDYKEKAGIEVNQDYVEQIRKYGVIREF